jgi:hypothetical protein
VISTKAVSRLAMPNSLWLQADTLAGLHPAATGVRAW